MACLCAGVARFNRARTSWGVVSLFADDATGKEFEAMVNIINSLKVTPKDAK